MKRARAKTPKLPPPLEHVEQTLFFRRVALDPRTRERCLFAIPNFAGHVGGKLARIRAGKRAKDEGRRAGVPDVFVAEPAPAFYGLFIEFKRQGNQPTPAQQLWHERLRLRRYRVCVCYTSEEAWTVLLDYLGLAGE